MGDKLFQACAHCAALTWKVHIHVPLLCDLFNFFVQKGKVPKAWKQANVVPIYKGGVIKPKDDVGSYRPVSLTSILCKVIEKLISIRIMKYVDEQQSGPKVLDH